MRLAAVAATSAALLGVVVALHAWKGVDYGYLTRDPAATMHARPYLGFLSQVGVALWGAAAATCFLARADARDPARRAFLLASGAFTTLLAIDDTFQLHEHLLPRVVGIPEPVVIVGWVLLAGAWLLRFRHELLAHEPVLLGTALGAFALSAGVDMAVAHPDDLQLLEEGAKLVGITAWVAYFAGVPRERGS